MTSSSSKFRVQDPLEGLLGASPPTIPFLGYESLASCLQPCTRLPVHGSQTLAPPPSRRPEVLRDYYWFERCSNCVLIILRVMELMYLSLVTNDIVDQYLVERCSNCVFDATLSQGPHMGMQNEYSLFLLMTPC
jgi:hypothetical protein